LCAESREVAVPWFARRRAIIALILGFVLPLPWPEVPVPAGLILILFIAAGGYVGDHNLAFGGPLVYLFIVGIGLTYAAALYVAATLWLLFREYRRWE
jgi:hypothetical protein